VIGKIRGDRKTDHGGINIEVRPLEAHTPGSPTMASENVSFDSGSLGSLESLGFGSDHNTISSLDGTFGAATPAPDTVGSFDDEVFRPLRPIIEYDPLSDPTADNGSGLSYAEEVDDGRKDKLGPVLGISAIVLIASGLYVLTKPSP